MEKQIELFPKEIGESTKTQKTYPENPGEDARKEAKVEKDRIAHESLAEIRRMIDDSIKRLGK